MISSDRAETDNVLRAGGKVHACSVFYVSVALSFQLVAEVYDISHRRTSDVMSVGANGHFVLREL
jgi:hypothetical protein